MKKLASALIILLVMTGAGCKQKKEEKSQLTYTPPVAPSNMEVDRLKQAAAASPKNATAWIELGNVLMDTQRFKEAVEAYEKALALDPKNVPVRVDLGTCYRGMREFNKAVEEYRKAAKIDPNFPNAHRNMGVVLAYDLHQNKEAIKEFQKYLEVAPAAPDAAEIRQSIQQLSSSK